VVLNFFAQGLIAHGAANDSGGAENGGQEDSWDMHLG